MQDHCAPLDLTNGCIRVIRSVSVFLSERDVELSSRLGHLLDLVPLFTSCLRFYSLSSAPLSMWRQKFMAKAALKRRRGGTRRTMRTKSKQGTCTTHKRQMKLNWGAGSCCFHGTTYMLFITILAHCWIAGIALFSGVEWNRQTGMHLQIGKLRNTINLISSFTIGKVCGLWKNSNMPRPACRTKAMSLCVCVQNPGSECVQNISVPHTSRVQIAATMPHA